VDQRSGDRDRRDWSAHDEDREFVVAELGADADPLMLHVDAALAEHLRKQDANERAEQKAVVETTMRT
jgi:hypothetical protein